MFYEVGGKEPTPRPLGEDHGTVVFDYQPVGTGIMNYFRYVLTTGLLKLSVIFVVILKVRLLLYVLSVNQRVLPGVQAPVQFIVI